MALEHLPDYQPKLVKRTSGQIEVWDTNFTPSEKQNASGNLKVEVQDPNYITEIDPNGGVSKRLHNMHDMDAADLSLESQAKLARELSGLPLRGDTMRAPYEGKIVEGVMGDYYTVDGKQYATLVQADGSRIGVHLEHLSPEAQEQFKETIDQEVGEAALDAADVDKPQTIEDKRHALNELQNQFESKDINALESYAIASRTGNHTVANINLDMMSPKARDIAGEYAALAGALVDPIEAGHVQAIGEKMSKNTESVQSTEHQSDPLESLSSHAKDEVLRYRTAQANKRLSEANKDFSQAGEDGKRVYEIGKSLSAEAKAFLGL